MQNQAIESFHHLFEHGWLPQMVYITKQLDTDWHHIRPMHRHDKICEILLISQGMGVYRINARAFSVEEGHLLYYNQGDTHELTSSLDKELGCYSIGITGLHLKGLPPNHILAPGDSYFQDVGALFPYLCALCEYLYYNHDHAALPPSPFALSFATFLSLAMACRKPFYTPSSSTAEFQLANHIRKYIDEHFREDLTLADIAQALNCSASYISSIFKTVIGYSPIQYLIRLRIGLAQNYLITTDYAVTHIATLVGYNNTNYFSTAFTKLVGVSPMKYRKNYLEGMKGKRLQ